MRAPAAKAPAPDDLLTCLARAAAAIDRPPTILTFSLAPAQSLMSHVFGPAATANLIARPGPTAGGAGEFSRLDGAAVSPLDFKPAVQALLPRFVDSAAFELTAGHFRGWLARAAAVIVHFPLGRSQGGILAGAGFRESRQFVSEGRETIVYLPAPERRSAPRAHPLGTGRPALRRLVIVDPCLGGARGHYAPYARSVTEGARAFGAEVVWGGHRRLDDEAAPAGVEVRRCFSRCFFDLDADGLATVDLAPELIEGWLALLDEFDGPETHFLAHNADAHLLRAAAGLRAARPDMTSAVHLGFHTAPRRMPGRAQGDEAHRVIARLRRAPGWERSLFAWAETERLGRWMSRWLLAPVPALPPLAPSGPGTGIRRRRPGGALTLSVLGESRPSKGFLGLPGIVDRIAATPALAGKVKVVIQAWRPLSGDGEKYAEAVARLAGHGFVEVVEGELDAEAYDRRLAEADVLLLPYDPEVYNLRGSGILTEGLSRGAIVLTRAGTAMEEEGGDGVVLTYEAPEDLVQVLAALAGGLDEAVGRAGEMAARFRAAHTPAAFVGALDERPRRPPQSAPAPPEPPPAVRSMFSRNQR
ncbi:MAG: hypothetical protein ACR2FH_05445 [Caulobacteraceae bacterium]